MGRLIKNGDRPMTISTETARKLRSYTKGEITWAEVEGMTWQDARAIAQVGCDLAAVGRLEEACGVFEGLVAGNPKDAACLAALGTVYQKLGRPQEAVKAYSAALVHNPKNAIALSNRGELRLKAGDPQGLKDLGQAVEADPSGKTAAGRRARALLQAVTMKTLAAAKAAAGT
jgi:tetratricopeptide (TPR) repeat protein